MTPPITVIERDDGTVWVFDLPDQAVRLPEATDVENDEYIAYDAQGLRLRFVRVFGMTRLDEARPRSRDPESLRGALLEFLRERGVQLSRIEALSLPDVLEATRPFRTSYPDHGRD